MKCRYSNYRRNSIDYYKSKLINQYSIALNIQFPDNFLLRKFLRTRHTEILKYSETYPTDP